jgi:hypothetical protein
MEMIGMVGTMKLEETVAVMMMRRMMELHHLGVIISTWITICNMKITQHVWMRRFLSW